MTPPPLDWAPIADRFRRNLTPALADELCGQLGLPRLTLDSLPGIGFDPASEAWTFPEQDGAGRIVGVARRFRDGRQEPIPGSRRGLIVPHGWRERDTSLLIVETPADVLALSLCAVSAIGRPLFQDGGEMLAALLAGFPSDREIIVMGDSDRKADAVRVAEALAAKLQRRIAWAAPPDGAKDIRTWILTQNPDHPVLDDWHIIGESLWEN